MKLGYSKICIDPEQETELSGYGWFLKRKATGIMDHIYARSFCLRDGGNAALVIVCDLLALSPYTVGRVRRALAKEASLQEEQVILASTHTHTAPSAAKTIGCGEVSWDYIKLLEERMIQAGLEAAQNMKEVTGVRTGTKWIEPTGYNRADADGPLDSNVYTVRFELEGGASYQVVNYANHPVTIGPRDVISPDYPAEVCSAMETEGTDAIFINGCCGDVDPVCHLAKWGGGTKETLVEYGARIAGGAREASENAPIIPAEGLCSTSFTFMLDTLNWGWNEVSEAAALLSEGQQAGEPIKRASEIWEEKIKDSVMNQDNPYEEEVFIQAFRIGKLVFVFAQGELFTQIGMDVRAAFADCTVIFASNSNAALRYVADDRDIAKKKSYGGLRSNMVYGKLPLQTGSAQKFAASITEGVKTLFI